MAVVGERPITPLPKTVAQLNPRLGRDFPVLEPS
jgi:hypothetical protein